MTIRWKLILLVTALIGIFLAAVAIVMHEARRDARYTEVYAQMRNLTQITSDLRATLYLHVAVDHDLLAVPAGLNATDWPGYALDDIDGLIRSARSQREQKLWQDVRGAVARLEPPSGGTLSLDDVQAAVTEAERGLRKLRNHYDASEARLVATLARIQFASHVAVWIAACLTVLLFLFYLVMVRHWLVRPVALLKDRATAIGQGRLEGRVPLSGRDELAQLARHMDAMAESLARQQEALLEARELSAIGEVCGNVAHGLRNPLAAMRSTAELAELQCADDPRLRDRLHELVRQVDRIDRRITEMFEFSRSGAPRHRAVTFAALAAQAGGHARDLLAARRIRLEVGDHSGATLWHVDADQVAAVLAELITNAAHHSPDGACIAVTGRAQPPDNGCGSKLEIAVVDQGSGMSPETMGKAFDMFFTSRPDGTGMGLALARRIVRAHGGELELHPSAGQGTTALLTLPGDRLHAGDRGDPGVRPGATPLCEPRQA